jgi:plastocyanin
MFRTALLATLVALAGPAVGQPITAAIDMTNFKFTPSQVALKANSQTVLQIRNDSSDGHSFSAPAFFAAAHVDPGSASLVQGGKIEVPPHATVRVALTPTAGQYPLKCSHPLHSAFGMNGTIIVR